MLGTRLQCLDMANCFQDLKGIDQSLAEWTHVVCNSIHQLIQAERETNVFQYFYLPSHLDHKSSADDDSSTTALVK